MSTYKIYVYSPTPTRLRVDVVTLNHLDGRILEGTSPFTLNQFTTLKKQINITVVWTEV